MFDWDDQELANILWGEDREADGHIIPYSEDIEKQVLSDYGNKDQKTQIGENSKGAIIDSQLDMPSLSTSKTENGDIAKRSQLAIGSENSPNHLEDKELDLVGNSWASIGSFDDLDRIFSNDGLQGDISLGSTDELWSSPKNPLSGVAKCSSAALGSTNWEFGTLGSTSNIDNNYEFLRNENPSSTTSSQKQDRRSPYSRHNIVRHVEKEESAVGTTDLADKKEKLSKIKIKQEKAAKRAIDFQSSASNFSQIDCQCAPATLQNYSASFSSQQHLSWNFDPMPYQHFSTPNNVAYAFGKFSSTHPVMDMKNVTEDEHHSILSGSEGSPGNVISLNKPIETSTKPTKMTPREKIEKLRRRQQMRAMLAIQKQQLRLGQQASNGDFNISDKRCQDDQVQQIGKGDLVPDEILSGLPCCDPGSPNKWEDSSKISSIEDHSVEDTVLYQLQDIISRLDMKIRLCIRDSLYRLAHTATQRYYASNLSSTKRSSTYEHDSAKEETKSSERFAGNVNVETETNQIDRAVAHLLFHRPLKLPVRLSETPESSTSTKVSTEQETATPSSLSVDLLGKSSEYEYDLTPLGPKSPRIFVDSHEEDTSNDVSQKVMRAYPRMKQMTAEHAD
ncbi:protein LNK2 isoform X2 [Amaranthus tricolor]|uniref:protein LNK2 isoform X2 n=1 Tax=Amaranthus tricolor TaxID=29722 RepID=UPI002587685F|nr:protein LNK2 isoform X2 [Amaranthus tricolor]XP_057520145.1 protein LNK2 isoform X2 [Amaranthus tricolor]